MRFDDLQNQGWMSFDDIDSDQKFCRIAEQLGDPVPSPSGEVVKKIIPRLPSDANANTLSHKFGLGAFPFHTDTAFWPIPARYAILRVTGDFRRLTRVITFSEMLAERGDLQIHVEQSVWMVKVPSMHHYCSMRFRNGQSIGFRYDANCMYPMNKAAHIVHDVFLDLVDSDCGIPIVWRPKRVVVLDNWRVLHARGPAPYNEGKRILERIYVR